MERNEKCSIKSANNQVKEMVYSLQSEFKAYDALYTDTEDWFRYLIDEPSNPDPKIHFPKTPSDISRTRKRIKVETIAEDVEEEAADTDTIPAALPIRRGSRTASKVANMKMKEPNLNTKLRRPSHSIREADETITSEAPPSKRARNGKHDTTHTKTSTATMESSFSSALDSFTSKHIDEPMETDDEVVIEKIESTKISKYKDSSMKSSSRLKSVSVLRSSKRVTRQRVTTVVVNTPTSLPAKTASTTQSPGDLFDDTSDFDDDDNIPIKILVTKPSVPKTTSSGLVKEKMDKIPIVLLEDIRKKKSSLTPTPGSKIDILSTAIMQQESTDDTFVLQSTDREKETPVTVEDALIAVSPIAQRPTEKKLETSKPKPLNNATNRNTPEANKNLFNRFGEPISVKKRVEALEKKLIVNPVMPAKPDLPVRMTRTKSKAMMAALSAVPPLLEKKTTQQIEAAYLMKLARKSVRKATKVSLAKDHRQIDLQKTISNEHTSPPRNTSKNLLMQNLNSTAGKNKTTQPTYVHPSRLLAQAASSKNPPVNLNANLSTFLLKPKVPSATEEAAEKRKEERRLRLENKENALLKKKALMEEKTEQQRKKREEKARNVQTQRALLEQEKAEMLTRAEKENEEKARLALEREENAKKEILRKKEEAKQKAALIEERRIRKEEERLHALKLQEEEQQRLQAQKKKEQEDADRLHAIRMHEEKERKEKEALKIKMQKQAKNAVATKTMDSTFVLDKRPPLVEATELDYPLADLSRGNDSDFSEAEDDHIPSWAHRAPLSKNLKASSGVPLKAVLYFFDSKPTTVDLKKVFKGMQTKISRSSSAIWRSPPRSSMVPMAE